MKKANRKKWLNFVIVLGFFVLSIMLAGCGEQASEVRVDGIKKKKKNIYLAEGQTAVISAQVFPFNANNQNYTFESSDNSVVTCEDGFVVAKKAGDAVISVYSEEGGYRDSCNVLVTRAQDNLELNNFNNLNMPPKELQPIYNSEDEATKTSLSAYAKPQASPITFNKLKNYAVKRLSDEVESDVNAGKNVLNDIKEEFLQFTDDLKFQKDTMKNLFCDCQNSVVDAFNNLHLTILDELGKTNQAMIDEIDNISQKVEAGEYTVESKELNGVTFVVISNSNNNAENI